MRNFTLKLWAAGSLLLALLLGTQTVAAAEFPAIEELYGRYRFSGELTAEFMNGMTGEPVDVVLPGTTDYDMVVLPGSGENEVQVLGFFGYGGGVTLSYDAQTGTLSGGFQEVLFCQGSGSLIVTVTAPYDPSAGGYVGTVDFKFKVGMVDGTIVLTSENALSDAQYIDYTTYDMGSMTYASGYTLTKEDVTADLSGLAGTYEFTSQVLDMNTLPDGSDLFDLEVSVSGGKVSLGNWFGVSGTAVEATYYEDGGILVLPHDAALSNGMYFGQEPEGMLNGNAAPYLLVNGDKLVLPGYVSLNNGSEDMGEMFMPIQYAIIGGEAVKTGSPVVEYPTVEELYGRYRFSGELTAEFMNGMTGEPVDVVLPGTTDYDMVVLPGSGENEVQVLGFFGYGGGVTLSYDAQTGTLSGGFQEVLFCQGSGSLIVTVTAPYDPSAGGYVGTVDFKFKVGMADGKIVLTSENALSDAQYIDYTTYDMGSMTYASGYTLTKEDVTADLSGLAGTYEFTSQVLDMNTLPDGNDLFDLEVSVSGDKVSLGNWFGVSGTAVEATYYEDGGILVLPHDAALSNGMYFGQEPEGMLNGNAAPYLLVNGDKLVLPGYVSLNNGSEDMGEMLMPIQYAIIGGEAVKKIDGDGIASYRNAADGIYVADGVIYVENGETVAVYNLQGMKVAEGISQIDGLKAGIYVVKAGNRTAKVALK